MFALLLPPRPLLTPASMQTISPTQSAYTFPSSPPFQHLSIFSLPDTALPPSTLAAIYIQFPGSSEFTLLGALGPDKQSATFRVNGLGKGFQGMGQVGGESGGIAEVDMDADVPATEGSARATHGDVTVGISIEPAATLEPQLAALAARQAQSLASANGTGGRQEHALALVNRGQERAQQPSTKVLAQRIIKNAFNFLASFEGGDGKVSLRSFEDWWRKFERRVEMDPGFLEREEGGS